MNLHSSLAPTKGLAFSCPLSTGGLLSALPKLEKTPYTKLRPLPAECSCTFAYLTGLDLPHCVLPTRLATTGAPHSSRLALFFSVEQGFMATFSCYVIDKLGTKHV